MHFTLSILLIMLLFRDLNADFKFYENVQNVVLLFLAFRASAKEITVFI